jgi:hypothetical protein
MAFVAGETDEDGEAATAAQIAAEDAEAEANRKAAEEKLKALKAERNKTEKPDPNRKSAYDGRELKPGEDPLPEKKDKNPELEPAAKSEPAPDPLAGINLMLRDAMRKDKVTVEEIMLVLGPKPKGFGYQPAGVHPEKWPHDFVMGITKEVNWKRIVAKIRSA